MPDAFIYPLPIVDHRSAVAFAKEGLYAIRRSSEARTEAGAVYRKHGSRKTRSARLREIEASDRECPTTSTIRGLLVARSIRFFLE